MTEGDQPTDAEHGQHELPAGEPAAAPRRRRTRSQVAFGMLGVVLCLVLGIAIVTQVRQTESGDSLETARPADLLVLLGSLQQREAALNTEVAELQRNLAAMQAAGTSDQAAIQNAQARLAALSILIGTVAATGPGVSITIADPGPGVAPETMLDVINELRAAGAGSCRRGCGERRQDSVANIAPVVGLSASQRSRLSELDHIARRRRLAGQAAQHACCQSCGAAEDQLSAFHGFAPVDGGRSIFGRCCLKLDGWIEIDTSSHTGCNCRRSLPPLELQSAPKIAILRND